MGSNPGVQGLVVVDEGMGDHLPAALTHGLIIMQDIGVPRDADKARWRSPGEVLPTGRVRHSVT
jgi:hypothetical protein